MLRGVKNNSGKLRVTEVKFRVGFFHKVFLLHNKWEIIHSKKK